jgi:hypothetical protein
LGKVARANGDVRRNSIASNTEKIDAAGIQNKDHRKTEIEELIPLGVRGSAAVRALISE